jgi:hypothetical protein
MGEIGYIETDFVTVKLDKPFNDPVIGDSGKMGFQGC